MRALGLILSLLKPTLPLAFKVGGAVALAARVLWRAAFAFLNEEALIRASSLAFTTLFSLIPLLTVGLSIMNFYGVSLGTLTELEHVLAQYLLPSQSRHVVTVVANAAEQVTKDVGALGLLGFCGTLILMARELEGHVLKICNKPTNWKTSAMHCAAFVVIAPTGVFLSYLLLHPLSSFLRFLPAEWSYINYPFLLAELVLIVLMRTFSGYSLSWAACTFGAIAAGVAAGASWEGCSLYFSSSAALHAYGSLAFIPAFMLWTFVTWCCVLFGVQIAAKAQEVLSTCPAASRGGSKVPAEVA